VTIGERIRALRKERGMTQKQVAEKCGMADSAIRKYESGSQTPKVETLQRIADALNVPLFSLLGSVSRTDPDFQMVMEYTGLTEQALYTITNGIRTFPGQDFPYNDGRTLTDILNSVLSDSPDFLTMLSFVKLSTAKSIIPATWGDSNSSIVSPSADQRGNEELACDYLRAIIKSIREEGKK